MRDCIVIGGGVVGLSIARRLARDGAKVTLLERGSVGREASWAGAGVLSPPNPHRQDAAAEIMLRSLAMYPQSCEELREETGIDPEYEVCGEIELAFDETGLRSLRDDVSAAGGRAIPSALLASIPSSASSAKPADRPFVTEAAPGAASFEMLSPAQARALEPAVSPEIVGAMLCREAAQVRNPRLLQSLRESCRRAGVELREHAPVTDFVESSGKVTGVRVGLEGQEMLAGDRVVLSAGAWSSQIAARLSERMPVRPVRGQMILLKFESRPFSHIIARGKTYLVPRRDGHVLLGATEEPRSGYDKRCTPRGIADLMAKGMKLVPGMAEAPLAGSWAGLRPGTPDDFPYIGPVPGMDGLIAATGHFRTGLSMAPATAEAVAAIVAGRPYDLDLSCCRPGRA